MKTPAVTLEAVQQARLRISDGLRRTPCTQSSALSDIVGMSLWCKRDFEQATGSFKERGARNALLSLSAAARARGVVAASAGNHALGLARHGALLGISVTVVMPRRAPQVKADRCRSLGATVVSHGDSFEQAAAHARELAREFGYTFIHPFDDPAVITGQGTLALEVLEELGAFDAILVPVGGGGLLAGVATAIKSLRPAVEVVGVEPVHAACFAVAAAAGAPVRVPVCPTLADGLAVSSAGRTAFSLAQHRVDRFVAVTEDDLAAAIAHAAEHEGWVIEGAGAAGLAACLSGKLSDLCGKRVVWLATGRNIDADVHKRALWRADTAARRAGGEILACAG